MQNTNTIMIDKREILGRIPHSGSMCLIDSVTQWDQDTITCLSRTHMLGNNPLRRKKKLPVSALVEYGAQAMAIHGSLLKDKFCESQGGYLAALKNIHFHVTDLSNVNEEISILANKVYSDGRNMIYNFSVADGDKELVSGRATVFGNEVTGVQQ